MDANEREWLPLAAVVLSGALSGAAGAAYGLLFGYVPVRLGPHGR